MDFDFSNCQKESIVSPNLIGLNASGGCTKKVSKIKVKRNKGKTFINGK